MKLNLLLLPAAALLNAATAAIDTVNHAWRLYLWRRSQLSADIVFDADGGADNAVE
jgi:hypothetical protein